MLKHLFIIDPFDSLIPGHDSSLAMMKSALQKKSSVWESELQDIYWDKNQVIAKARPILLKQQKVFRENHPQKIFLEEGLCVWMRKDPPVDENYVRVCQLLRLAKAKVINDPNFLMACDEKLFTLEFPNLMPRTWIHQNINSILHLLEKEKKLIAKPIGGKGGEGILVLHQEDKNKKSLLEILTKQGKNKIVLQEYLEEAKEGDKRIFLLAGESIGAVLRIPDEKDHRANMSAGGSIAKTDLTPNEQKICEEIKPRLLELGLYIVGLDIIGEKITEINITSPTGLEEIAKLDGTNPARKIIEWSENFS